MTNGHYVDEGLLAPYSQESEEAVLGAVLISANQFPILRGFLRPGHFYLIRHRIIWQAFQALSDRDDIIDMTSVVSQIQSSGQLEDVGGIAYIIRLTSECPNSMHAETYAKMIHRLALRREMLEAADQLRVAALDEKTSTDAAIHRLDRTALDLRRDLTSVDAPTRQITQATTSKYERLMESKKRHKDNPLYVIGVRTGISDLDALLDGLRPGITTLAGATGSGKTALGLQIVRKASSSGILRTAPSPANTHFFSGEMTEDQLMNRMLSGMTGVPVRTIERGSFNSQQESLLIDAMQDLDQNHRLTFEGASRMNTAQIRQRVREMTMNNELDLLVLDGLLQIEAVRDDPRDSGSHRGYKAQQRRDLIEEIMNELENAAISYSTPILTTHQLSRAPSGRAEKRPILSDLAEASFVEQKSAVILFLYREGYYNAQADNPNAAEIIVAKNRHGETGTIHQIYDAQFTRFVDADRSSFTLGD